nr:uncharacterized protein LOC111420901 [Onthophagus taurus]
MIYKMFLIFLFVLLVMNEEVIVLSARTRCRCWEGYRPQRADGELKCYSKELFHWMSCNVPKPPKCICTGNNGVLKDHSGTWCTVYEDGNEHKRWHCENSQEWELFLKSIQNLRRSRNF